MHTDIQVLKSTLHLLTGWRFTGSQRSTFASHKLLAALPRIRQNGGKSAGFSVFSLCAVALQGEGFVFLSDADFVQDQPSSEIVCFRHKMIQMSIGYFYVLLVFVILFGWGIYSQR